MQYDIEVKNLRKEFGRGKKKIIALNDVTFKVKKGEIFGFLGVNGAGKTTTINILTGLLKKDGGEFSIMGLDPVDDREILKNNINVSTAYYPLSDVLSVYENLLVYAKIYGVKKPKVKIQKLLKQFELESLKKRQVINLSSGEKTRVALCKGLINNPKVLFLDECTVGLDPDIAEKTRKIIKKYQKENECTILFTSHYMGEVEELCDRIAFIEKGRIKRIATADQLKKSIKKRTVKVSVRKDALKLIKFLKSEKVKILSIDGNQVVFEVTYLKDKIYKIMNKIFAKGFMLNDLHIQKPTLEKIFIDFARRK